MHSLFPPRAACPKEEVIFDAVHLQGGVGGCVLCMKTITSLKLSLLLRCKMSTRSQLAEYGVRPGFQVPKKETDLHTSPALLISLKEKSLH